MRRLGYWLSFSRSLALFLARSLSLIEVPDRAPGPSRSPARPGPGGPGPAPGPGPALGPCGRMRVREAEVAPCVCVCVCGLIYILSRTGTHPPSGENARPRPSESIGPGADRAGLSCRCLARPGAGDSDAFVMTRIAPPPRPPSTHLPWARPLPVTPPPPLRLLPALPPPLPAASSSLLPDDSDTR